jgi:hypothetical protein
VLSHGLEGGQMPDLDAEQSIRFHNGKVYNPDLHL